MQTATLTTIPHLYGPATVPVARPSSAMDLILPCYNPPPGWTERLITDFRRLEYLMPDTLIQLILVNDGSTSNVTEKQLQHLQEQIPGVLIINHPINRGKGYALRLGVALAKTPYQVCTDYDMPFGVEAICRAYEQLLRGYDVVAGERGRQYLVLLPRQRRMITFLNRLMNAYLLRLRISDAQAGLKAFNSRGRKELLSTRINGFLYDSEFVHRAGRNKNLAIQTVSISCRQDIRFSDFRSGILFREFFNFIRIMFTH